MPAAVYLALLFSVLAFIMSVVSFFFFRSYLRRRTGQERILSELRQGVDSIVLSLDEKTDRDISLIEERERNLKSLLDEVDKRLKVYIREMEKRREDEAAHTALAAKAMTYQELGKNRYRLSRQEAAPAPPSAPQPAPQPAPQSAPPPAEAPVTAPLPVGEQIRELLRAGFSPPVIASRLGLSIAEVEVVTALMERRGGQ